MRGLVKQMQEQTETMNKATVLINCLTNELTTMHKIHTSRIEECGRLEDTITKLSAALEVCYTALMEVQHAQQAGSGWYTHGDMGLRQQVRMWLDRGFKAIREALAAVEDGT